MGTGAIIKAILKEQKKTIKQLAAESGVSLNTLYSITKRDSTAVTYPVLQKIADALGVEVKQLLPSKEFEAFFEADKNLFDPVPPTEEEVDRVLQELDRLVTGERKQADFSDVPAEQQKKLGQILDYLGAVLRLSESNRALAHAYEKEMDKRENAKKEALYVDLLRIVMPLSLEALERVVQVVKLFVENSLGVSISAPDAEKKNGGKG